MKAHADELKKAIGYTGDPKWFADEANSKKSHKLFKSKQWFAVSAHKPMAAIPAELAHDMKPLKEGQLPFKLEGDITDAGWCWLGWGEKRVHLRLGVDLGSTCSFGTTGVFDEIMPMIKAGDLGAARLASEVPKVVADSWNGKKDEMKNWVQLVVTANNVQGVQTICIGQFVTFCRKSEERVLVAGKDLAHCLGFELVPEQIKHQSTRGIDPEVVLGDGAPGRTYVMSAAQQDKITHNRRLAELQSQIFGDGLAYIGNEAFRHVRPMQWANDPVLRHSYITTAALHQAGSSANKLKYEGVLSELAVQDHQALGDWLVDTVHPGAAEKVVGLVDVDVIRVVSETRPFARLEKVRFRVIQSTQRRVVFGADVMSRLDAQDEDCPDPLQSDMEYDERAMVTNYLEVAFDQARLNGLPKKHWKRYRKLIFATYFRVFRTRLGREAPALLPAMKVEVYPGDELKQGYKISFDKLTAPQLEQMRVELDRNKDMGVLGDAPLGAVLHAMLTILKQDGSMRWVIACMAANDIIRPMWWDQPDNATSQQQRMRGAKYYWLADMLKGYWQLELHPDSRWLFCFATPWGPMMYLRAPMGYKITAPWFCMCMARVLDAAKLLHRGVEMIQDDHGGHAEVIFDEDPNGRSH